MGRGITDDNIESLLAEQIAYYRALAPEYGETALPIVDPDELSEARHELQSALDAFAPNGDVLELACGPGTWTGELLRYASSVTAVDAAAEMLAIAAATHADKRIRFVEADLFSWEPDRRYDVVFFGFWLSHVPPQRFERFWSMVARCLKPSGRVFFIDDGYREPEELIEGENSTTIQRRLKNGSAYRAVKVPHTPAQLERQLAELGWQITVTSLPGPFYWGAGGRPVGMR